MAITDKFSKPSNGSQPLPAQLSAQKVAGATTASLTAATGWDTTSVKHVRMYQTQVVNGQTVPNQSTICFYVATLSGTTLSNIALIWSATGSDQTYPAGATVDLSVTAEMLGRQYDGITAQHNQDGTHSAVTATSVTASGTITAANFVRSGGAGDSGWSVGATAPTACTYNGNRSYSLTYASSIAGYQSPGMRRRVTRTVAAPTQCTSLNGTTQYYSKATPSKMTFTDDFVVSAWIKLSSYPTSGQIGQVIGRTDGTSGFMLWVTDTGQVTVNARNAGVGNFSRVTSYQSVPLNKWVHITGQLDMSAYTATPTTSYVMIDGVDVPASVIRGGTLPTALVQAGNLEVGRGDGVGFWFPGKIAQAAVFSAKVTQATMRTYMSQGLVGTETNLASAYSFNNSITDLNTTTPNDLTANGSAVATNADSPFGNYGVSTTLEYAITTAVSSDGLTETVQVPEGCALPTTGGISSVDYSTQKAPYGMPIERGKWSIEAAILSSSAGATAATTWYNRDSAVLIMPIGSFVLGYSGNLYTFANAATTGGNYTNLSYAAANGTPVTSRLTTNTSSTTPGANTSMATVVSASDSVTVSTATPVYANAYSAVAVAAMGWQPGLAGTRSLTIYAELAYL